MEGSANLFIWPSILFFSLFSVFAYFNRRWAELGFPDARGSGLHKLVSLMGFAAIGVGMGYLAWYGLSISWIGAGTAFAVSVAFVSAGASADRFVRPQIKGIGSIVLWPIFATFMIWTLLEH